MEPGKSIDTLIVSVGLATKQDAYVPKKDRLHYFYALCPYVFEGEYNFTIDKEHITCENCIAQLVIKRVLG